jgi:hypothetical protein
VIDEDTVFGEKVAVFTLVALEAVIEVVGGDKQTAIGLLMQMLGATIYAESVDPEDFRQAMVMVCKRLMDDADEIATNPTMWLNRGL